MTLGLTITTLLMAFVISLILMPPFIRLMQKYRILDKSGGRKINKVYKVHMGGIIIFISIVFTVAIMIFISSYVFNAKKCFMTLILLLMLCLGIEDDRHNAKPIHKFLSEIIIGILMAFADIRIDNLCGYLGVYDIPILISYLITICFFIVVVNSFNLIDGIDGQAGMQALNVFLFSFLFYAVVIHNNIKLSDNITEPIFMYLVSLAAIGAIIGFLRYNWQPSKIFMCDAGSLSIGTLITIFIIVNIKYACIISLSKQEMLMGLHLKSTIAPFLFLFYFILFYFI